jgi:hypothetical protein
MGLPFLHLSNLWPGSTRTRTMSMQRVCSWWWTSWPFWYRRWVRWKPHGRMLKNTWCVHFFLFKKFSMPHFLFATFTSFYHVFSCFHKNIWISTFTFYCQVFYYSLIWQLLSPIYTHKTPHMVPSWHQSLHQYPWHPTWHSPTTTWRINTFSRNFTTWTKPSNQDYSISFYPIRHLEERDIQPIPCPAVLWNNNPWLFDKKRLGWHQTTMYPLVPPPSSNCDDHSKTLWNSNTTIITSKLVFPWIIYLPIYQPQTTSDMEISLKCC